MFNRYWRTYPWGLQVVLFTLMVSTLSSFATYLVLALLPRVTGLTFNDLVHLGPLSTLKTIRTALIAQAAEHNGTFLAPALLFASFAHPRVREYLGIRAPGKPIHWLLVTGIMLGLIPVFLWGESWMARYLHFGKWADNMQQENDNIIKAFMKLNTGPDLGMLLAILAFLPALGEELLFRGILLRLMHQLIQWISRMLPSATVGDAVIQPGALTMLIPVIFTALLFAFLHTNPYGFVFIFIAGCVLAMIYNLTGSLLCSMWAHFLYNGTQVAAVFVTQHNEAAQKVAGGENLPIAYPLIGLLLFALSFYALVRTQTPLPVNWSADFEKNEE